MPRYIAGAPLQGALYHQLVAQVQATHAGLGANNVGQPAYRALVGQSFQKPLSGSTTRAANVYPPVYR